MGPRLRGPRVRRRATVAVFTPEGPSSVTHSEIVSFLWGVADLIRDTFKRGKYQDVILPLTVLRRLDCVLAPTKEKVLEAQAKLRDASSRTSTRSSGRPRGSPSTTPRATTSRSSSPTRRTSRPTCATTSPASARTCARCWRSSTSTTPSASSTRPGSSSRSLERFKNVDLHPDKVDNPTMGTIFEELIRKFNEALNENPGEHFTPRDVVHLMVDLMLAGDEERIRRRGVGSAPSTTPAAARAACC